jgi:DNA polymerase I
VLGPIIDDRAGIKEELRTTDDPARAELLQARSDALKWILVSCFGYQGYRNAKFGRIECHEALNAYAREILLDAKETLERNGWRVVHGIVDSLWVQPVASEDQIPLTEVAETISTAASIPMEIEDHFEWVCFVPRRDGDAGALTKYFGAVADRDEYKIRGIEARQRSTPQFVESLQRELLRVVDRERSPAAVADRVARALGQLRCGAVDSSNLVITKRVSKEPAAYQQRTHTVAALERAADLGLSRHPGQDVSYVVVDDDRQDAMRVRLAHESPSEYDAEFYRELVIRAAESVVSPLGWGRKDLTRHFAGVRTPSLSAFESTD